MFSSPAPSAHSSSSSSRFEAMKGSMRATSSRLRSRLLIGLLLVGVASANAANEQPRNPPKIALDELQPGMKGEVWTVFQGKKPEPFEVEVTGVIRNAVGPGKALILCQLTDPKVQAMGAVAGMSGSPLYIDGRLAGALSYQVQRFETVRYAGFTPADDLAEVAEKVGLSPLTPPPVAPSHPAMAPRSATVEPFQALTPVFSLTGLSPGVADLLGPQFRSLGLATSTVGGSNVLADGSAGGKSSTAETPSLNPGEAVAVALAVGDITIAGTGTVSTVDGNRITAFGHPMLGIGDVAL
ncbi:MAG TPA: SpoIVB peptidase S55 domain-containing protein, partial [Opitutaceae bacterium]|nr:SpoIVB peptidase S55 domain-containing protein [Opitutaceae bacterium]